MQTVKRKPSRLNPFEGVLTSFLSVKRSGEVISSKEVRFSHIILNVKHGDLHAALRSALNDCIDNFIHRVGWTR